MAYIVSEIHKRPRLHGVLAQATASLPAPLAMGSSRKRQPLSLRERQTAGAASEGAGAKARVRSGGDDCSENAISRLPIACFSFKLAHLSCHGVTCPNHQEEL